MNRTACRARCRAAALVFASLVASTRHAPAQDAAIPTDASLALPSVPEAPVCHLLTGQGNLQTRDTDLTVSGTLTPCARQFLSSTTCSWDLVLRPNGRVRSVHGEHVQRSGTLDFRLSQPLTRDIETGQVSVACQDAEPKFAEFYEASAPRGTFAQSGQIGIDVLEGDRCSVFVHGTGLDGMAIFISALGCPLDDHVSDDLRAVHHVIADLTAADGPGLSLECSRVRDSRTGYLQCRAGRGERLPVESELNLRFASQAGEHIYPAQRDGDWVIPARRRSPNPLSGALSDDSWSFTFACLVGMTLWLLALAERQRAHSLSGRDEVLPKLSAAEFALFASFFSLLYAAGGAWVAGTPDLWSILLLSVGIVASITLTHVFRQRSAGVLLRGRRTATGLVALADAWRKSGAVHSFGHWLGTEVGEGDSLGVEAKDLAADLARSLGRENPGRPPEAAVTGVTPERVGAGAPSPGGPNPGQSSVEPVPGNQGKEAADAPAPDADPEGPGPVAPTPTPATPELSDASADTPLEPIDPGSKPS